MCNCSNPGCNALVSEDQLTDCLACDHHFCVGCFEEHEDESGHWHAGVREPGDPPGFEGGFARNH